MKKNQLKRKRGNDPFPSGGEKTSLRLAKPPQQKIEKEEANGRPWTNFFKKSKENTFVITAPQRDNLKFLLESIYTAALIKQKRLNFITTIIAHPDNQLFLKQTELFDRIITVNENDDLKGVVQDICPTVLYDPSHELKGMIKTAFIKSKIKICGGRKNILSRLLKIKHTADLNDATWLKKKGIDLTPEFVSLSLQFDLAEETKEIPRDRFVWLSLFDSHIVNGEWPIGHASRFIRILNNHDIKTIIPIHPQTTPKIEKEIEYLQKNSPSVIILRNCTPQNRLAGMLKAEAIIALAGPETLLASLIRKPVFLLHDMNSFNRYDDPRGLKVIDSKSPVQNGKKGNTEKHNPLLFKVSDSQEKHIKPSVLECANECSICEFNSCTAFISPERVFEKMKSTLFTFPSN